MTDKSLKDYAINFKGSDYVQVKDRVLYLAEHYEGRYEIYQDYEYFPNEKMWVVKTKLVIWDEAHQDSCEYEWLAQEIEWSSYINKTSALENASTSSLWRSIACLGVWVLSSFASADEIEKAQNREKATDWPFKDKEEKKTDDWYEKTLANTKFMADCLDENSFITKIKARVKEIWTTMTAEQEKKLRIAYNNFKAMENISFDQSVLPTD